MSSREVLHRQPWRLLAGLFAAWLAAAGANALARAAWPDLRTPELFPVTLFARPQLHVSGLPGALAFCLLLVTSWRHAARGAPVVLALAVGMVVTGNLAQGGFDAGFVAPLRASGIQYAHEAARVGDAAAWLRGFNDAQAGLLPHSRTHPPFAVLLHVGLLRLGGGSLPWVAGALVLLSVTTLEALRRALAAFGVARERRHLVVCLAAALPAANVFLAVSLDGVVCACAAIALWGAARLEAGDRRGIALVAIGALAMSLLTFASVILFGVIAALAARAFVVDRRVAPAAAFAASLALAFVVFAFVRARFGYDHLQAFRTASRIENPEGFALLARPRDYVLTRAEDVGEVLFFFSFGALALVPAVVRAAARPVWRDSAIPVAAAAAAVVLAAFAAGAFKTGETARACLFAVPFFLVPFARLEATVLRDSLLWAGGQTVVMQLVGGFFW